MLKPKIATISCFCCRLTAHIFKPYFISCHQLLANCLLLGLCIVCCLLLHLIL